MIHPVFLGPGLALPGKSLSSGEYAELAVRLCARTPREALLIRAAARRSQIDRRHSVLADAAADMPFFSHPAVGGEAPPDTQERMAVYEREAPGLALAASRRLLDAERVDAGAVTHLITVSCTGFMAPGLDFHLVRELGLAPTTRRLHLGFQGCHAALNAFGAARAICLGDRGAVVLVALVELCTLHFQQGCGRDDMLPNALFADGAAAFVIAGSGASLARQGHYAIAETHSHLIAGTPELMTWRITDRGFRMTLDASVPEVVGRVLPGLAREWNWEAGLPGTAWAIHPGGPRILQRAAEAFGLDADAVAASSGVLRRHGNMSSATLLFILDVLLRSGPARVRMLAFGPGLNVEAGTLVRVGGD